MALNVAKAVARSAKQVLQGKPLLVPDSVKDLRWSTCEPCDRFMVIEKRCSVCGCFARSFLVGKIELAVESCTLGEWPAWDGVAAVKDNESDQKVIAVGES